MPTHARTGHPAPYPPDTEGRARAALSDLVARVQPPPRVLLATVHASGFPHSHDTYNGIGVASNGKVYYVLCSGACSRVCVCVCVYAGGRLVFLLYDLRTHDLHPPTARGYAQQHTRTHTHTCTHPVHHNVPGELHEFDPATQRHRRVADLDTACGHGGKAQVSQGKSHVPFVEHGGKLYFATHLGYYSIRDGMETIGEPPAGCQRALLGVLLAGQWGRGRSACGCCFMPTAVLSAPLVALGGCLTGADNRACLCCGRVSVSRLAAYQGGHFLSYDLASGAFESHGVAPRQEGVITMAMDTHRGRMYGLTWPCGRFISTSVTVGGVGGAARGGACVARVQDHGAWSRGGEAVRGPECVRLCIVRCGCTCGQPSMTPQPQMWVCGHS